MNMTTISDVPSRHSLEFDYRLIPGTFFDSRPSTGYTIQYETGVGQSDLCTSTESPPESCHAWTR
jgi:hypothetical protein